MKESNTQSAVKHFGIGIKHGTPMNQCYLVLLHVCSRVDLLTCRVSFCSGQKSG